MDSSNPSVPVHDCHVIISGPDADGLLHGYVSNLPQIAAAASNERDLLQRLVKDFKSLLIDYRSQNKAVPWEPPQTPQPGDRQRWIPVHL